VSRHGGLTALLRGLLTALLLTVGLGAVPASSAPVTSTQLTFILGHEQVLSESQVPFTETGALTVIFAGSQTAGCAAVGVCPYSGRIAALPVTGDLIVARVRIGHRVTDYVPGRSFADAGSGPDTTSEVDRTLPGGVTRCAEAVPSGGLLDTHLEPGRMLKLQLLGPDTQVLATRCAGPTDAGLAAVSPRVTLPLVVAQHGRRTLDLSRSSRFASGGFAGTLTSTIHLRLGRPQRLFLSGKSQFPPHTKLVRDRLVFEALKLEGVRGRLEMQIAGTPDHSVCPLLDVCGLQGAIDLVPHARNGSGDLAVGGPARIPESRFRASLGLTSGARPLALGGGLSWEDSGAATVSVSQGGNTCRATAPIEGASLQFRSTRRRVLVTLGTSSTLRSECPGPFVAASNQMTQLAAGSLPLSRLGRRTFSVRLHTSGTISDEGYVIRLRGALTVRIRRGRITQQIVKEPSGV
jgi:hypothetical protein